MQSARTAEEGLRTRNLRALLRTRIEHLQPAAPIRPIVGREAAGVRLGQKELRILHPERTKDPSLQKLGERLAADRLHEAADDQDAGAVNPAFAGLVLERQPREPAAELGQVRLFLILGDREIQVAERSAVLGGMPGGVRQHVAQQDGVFCRPATHDADAIDGFLAGEHLRVGEFGQVAAHGIVRVASAVLAQQQQGERGDRLGHRGQAEDAVARHRPARLEVGVPLHAQVGDLSAAGDQRHGPGDLTSFNRLGYRSVEAGEDRGIETERGGVGGRQPREQQR